jgi:hypothetical protein
VYDLLADPADVSSSDRGAKDGCVRKIRWNGALLALASLLLSVPAWAEAPVCPAGVPIATFRLYARPVHGGPALPVSAVNVIKPGEMLVYEPARESTRANSKGEIAVVLVPEDVSLSPAILPARRAAAATEWPVPMRVSAIGVVFGPNGINEKQLGEVLQKDPGAVDRLADYAEQNSKVEALVHALSAYEQSAPGDGSLQSALNEFSSHYSVALPALDRSKPADQQAAALLRALTPAFSAANTAPLGANLVQQAGGLAASVASLFFGSPVSLAIGGAALVGNMHTALFPPTDFQSAFTAPRGDTDLALCLGGRKPASHARLEFVWMLRLPDRDAPTVTLPESVRVPIGWTSTIQLHCASVAQLKALPRARDWRLVSTEGSVAVPVSIATGDTTDAATLDLRRVPIAAGEYRLSAAWDWTPLQVAGIVNVRPFANFSAMRLSSDSEDRLVSGAGPVPVTLTGADFEFVDRVALAGGSPAKKGAPAPLTFTLSMDPQSPDRRQLEATVDTTSLKPDSYQLVLTERNGATHQVALLVHAADPTLSGLPNRANVGEHEQRIQLHGTHLERIDRITSADATWTLSPNPHRAHELTARTVTIQLGPDARVGEHIGATVFAADRHAPIDVPDALDVVAPRPAITSSDQSFASRSDVALRPGELPVGVPVSFVIHATGLGARPTIRLACASDETRRMAVGLDQDDGHATLALAGDEKLFLSIDPGRVGQSGCVVSAIVDNEATGASDPYQLGRIVRLPRIDRFSISDETAGDGLYIGTLVGEGLELIDRTGWTATVGSGVLGIATPVPDAPGQQTLRIAVPWPSPSPHAPLYVWLVGEHNARLTTVKY